MSGVICPLFLPICDTRLTKNRATYVFAIFNFYSEKDSVIIFAGFEINVWEEQQINNLFSTVEVKRIYKYYQYEKNSRFEGQGHLFYSTKLE